MIMYLRLPISTFVPVLLACASAQPPATEPSTSPPAVLKSEREAPASAVSIQPLAAARPDVAVRDPEVERALVEEVRARSDEFKRCPDASGRVEIWVAVEPSGRVVPEKVLSNRSAALDQCVLKLLGGIRIPGHREWKLDFLVPLVFEPGLSRCGEVPREVARLESFENVRGPAQYWGEMAFDGTEWRPAQTVAIPPHHATRLQLSNAAEFPLSGYQGKRLRFTVEVTSREVQPVPDRHEWRATYFARITNACLP